MQIVLICMNRVPKEFEHSVVNFVSSYYSAGVCDNNHSPKCKSFTSLCKRLLCIDVTSAVHPTACKATVFSGWQTTYSI